MELVLDKCSMCGTRDMVELPHADTGVVFMGCPNCDGPMVCPFPNCDRPECKEGTKSVMPPNVKQYLGVGPNSERP